MAIYKIFPEKDTTIYSAYPTINTGLDQILEIQNQPPHLGENTQISRILIKFSSSTIQDVINTKVGASGSYDSYLRLFLANAYNLPDNYTIHVNPVSQSWESGIGKFLYNPADDNNCSWVQRSNGVNWPSESFSPNTTASFKSNNAGGASWFVSFEDSQSFVINDIKDIDIPVTNIVEKFYDNTISNEGFLIRMESDYEFNNSSSFSLKYFSKDTHTIYLPQLEIRWDDSSYNTGSLVVLTNENNAVTLGNNIGEYKNESIYRFRVNARVIFPRRAFTTQSVYLFNSALPSSSYWALQDSDTGEYVVDFDENYTKISCDPEGNYFDLYMNGLQSERYYKVLIKSSFSNGSSTVVYDNNYIFKIFK